MLIIKCRPERKITPVKQEDEVGFMVCSYIPEDPSALPFEMDGPSFIAKGPLLPYAKASCVTLYVESVDASRKNTCIVAGYDEDVPNTSQGARSFLGTICSQKDVNRIMNCIPTGEPPLPWLDGPTVFPKAFRSQQQRKAVENAYMLRRSKKHIFYYLAERKGKRLDHQACAEAACAIESLDALSADPFGYSVKGIIPYFLSKQIAKEESIAVDCPSGIQAALMEALLQAEGSSISNRANDDTSGHMFTCVEELMTNAGNILGLSKDDIRLYDALEALVTAGLCSCAEGKYVYRAESSNAEYGIAEEVIRLMDAPVDTQDYTWDIYALENGKNWRIGEGQRNALNLVLSYPFSLLMGGPGTGKSTIEEFIMKVFKKYHDEPVLLVAPTGKAARRMAEATGQTAYTVHKALGVSERCEVIDSSVQLDAGLIIVDEASMLSSQVCYALFKAIKTGTRVVLVGDTNQLPSVGAGNVLYELATSNVIPVARLEKVYRQKDGSRIAYNCARVMRGNPTLDMDETTFRFEEVNSQAEAADMIVELYKQELSKGTAPADICVLSPFKKNTPTSVNALNSLIQGISGNAENDSISYGDKRFFVGDKVMMMVNEDDVSNGDIGYITAIKGNQVAVDFGDGRNKAYTKGDLKKIELAYAMTIHKSQGTEAKICFIVLMLEHAAMLKRNLIYTAISRSKQTCVLVGQKRALEHACKTEDVSVRRSMLGHILASVLPPLKKAKT